MPCSRSLLRRLKTNKWIEPKTKNAPVRKQHTGAFFIFIRKS
jgi:hypothetical protein